MDVLPPTGPPLPVENPLRESVFVLGRWIRAQVLISAILTVLYAVCFAAAGVPWWALVAVCGGMGSFIPRLGAFLPLLLAGLAILLSDRNLTHFLLAFAGWALIQAFEGFFLTPRLLSKPLGLKPWLVFVALLAGSFLFGPLGLMLAVPVLAVAGVFYRYFRKRGVRIPL